MTQDQQKDYEALQDMFLTDGWKLLMSEFNETKTIRESNAVWNCNTNDEWQEHRGYMRCLYTLLNYPNMLETTMDEQEGLDHDTL